MSDVDNGYGWWMGNFNIRAALPWNLDILYDTKSYTNVYKSFPDTYSLNSCCSRVHKNTMAISSDIDLFQLSIHVYYYIFFIPILWKHMFIIIELITQYIHRVIQSDFLLMIIRNYRSVTFKIIPALNQYLGVRNLTKLTSNHINYHNSRQTA